MASSLSRHQILHRPSSTQKPWVTSNQRIRCPLLICTANEHRSGLLQTQRLQIHREAMKGCRNSTKNLYATRAADTRISLKTRLRLGVTLSSRSHSLMITGQLETVFKMLRSTLRGEFKVVSRRSVFNMLIIMSGVP